MTPEQSKELIQAIQEHGQEIRYAALGIILCSVMASLIVCAAICDLIKAIKDK